ncbi:hypothetical protein EVAR_91755_1 [Eumeta japonica]|uniref:Uncharacterized protein n=1 Tax=Eumeta variegata TaxID=151549 RepID=A0A4C1SLQ3_EUMVA|nr:hypothetical protein EVAR_91755_1 [Eumeta japonica]
MLFPLSRRNAELKCALLIRPLVTCNPFGSPIHRPSPSRARVRPKTAAIVRARRGSSDPAALRDLGLMGRKPTPHRERLCFIIGSHLSTRQQYRRSVTSPSASAVVRLGSDLGLLSSKARTTELCPASFEFTVGPQPRKTSVVCKAGKDEHLALRSGMGCVGRRRPLCSGRRVGIDKCKDAPPHARRSAVRTGSSSKRRTLKNEWSQIAINGSPGARGRRRRPSRARRIEKLGPRGLHPAHCGSGAADDPDR